MCTVISYRRRCQRYWLSKALTVISETSHICIESYIRTSKRWCLFGTQDISLLKLNSTRYWGENVLKHFLRSTSEHSWQAQQNTKRQAQQREIHYTYSQHNQNYKGKPITYDFLTAKDLWIYIWLMTLFSSPPDFFWAILTYDYGCDIHSPI